MTLDEVQELMPECKIAPFVDGMYLAFPKHPPTAQEWHKKAKRIEECFSIKKEHMTDLYASEEETNALIQPDTRTPEQKKAAKLADKNWMNEQGAEPQRAWVGLARLEIDEAAQLSTAPNYLSLQAAKMFWAGTRWAENKLKEKNT